MVQEARGPHREGLQQDPEGEVPVGHRHDHERGRGVRLLIWDTAAIAVFSPFRPTVR